MTELPYTISVPFFNALVVHAGLVPGIILEEQKPTDMYIIRTIPSKSDGESDTGIIYQIYFLIEDIHVY